MKRAFIMYEVIIECVAWIICFSLCCTQLLFATPSFADDGKLNKEKQQSLCEPGTIGPIISKNLGVIWNEGRVRSWNDHGEFWSMPYTGSLDALSNILKNKLGDHCLVHIGDQGGFTARIMSKTKSEHQAHLISSNGSTLGVLSPVKGEMLVIMYAAKIAASIAEGKRLLQNNNYIELSKDLACESDIEYQFGKINIDILSGSLKMTVDKAALLVFGILQKKGYRPIRESLGEVQKFDGWIMPEKHESFWSTPQGIVRIELKKLKHGRVYVALNETSEGNFDLGHPK